jgi:hypothetical protein
MKRLSFVLTCLALGCGSNFSSSPSFPSEATPHPTLDSTLTLTMSPTCDVITDSVTHRAMSFPDYARVRHFPVTLTDDSLFVSNGGQYDASRKGDQLTIVVPPSVDILNDPQRQPGACGGGDYWWDGFGTATPYGYLEHVEVCGTWHAHVDDRSNIHGTLDGAFLYLKGIGPKFETVLYCRATDHEFTITTP